MLSALILAACGGESSEKNSASKSSKKLSVVATIYPQYDWLKNIIGDASQAIDLKLLIKNGTDLHSYKPSAQDIASIAGADMVVYLGGESDEWIEKALAATPKADRVQVNLMKTLGDRVKEEEVVEGMEHHHHHDGEHAEEHEHEHHEHAEAHEDHEHHGEHAEEHEHEHHEHAEAHEGHEHHHEAPENDEHVWLSLKNAVILVNDIARSLSKLDPENASTYQANAQAYVAKIQELDQSYAAAVAGAGNKTVLFGDRFPFRYLVDDYGLKYYAAFVGCSAESEASFETVAFLAGKMDSLSLPAIFTIDGSNGKIARAILDASKKSKEAQVLVLNSMQSVKDEQVKAGADYLSIMAENLEVLKKALK